MNPPLPPSRQRLHAIERENRRQETRAVLIKAICENPGFTCGELESLSGTGLNRKTIQIYLLGLARNHKIVEKKETSRFYKYCFRYYPLTGGVKCR